MGTSSPDPAISPKPGEAVTPGSPQSGGPVKTEAQPSVVSAPPRSDSPTEGRNPEGGSGINRSPKSGQEIADEQALVRDSQARQEAESFSRPEARSEELTKAAEERVQEHERLQREQLEYTNTTRAQIKEAFDASEQGDCHKQIERAEAHMRATNPVDPEERDWIPASHPA